ncbi:hypothetical protein L596_013931 [Steinernema carpocapsae]|uniref:Uncharacterized protein n=1 Tax=Steinernema carpocapsae TaxID=34508 RepID=A0A4U5P1T8_STECR|nr:hypothetical protein L596_013931 [Steinernema carpocapsae]
MGGELSRTDCPTLSIGPSVSIQWRQSCSIARLRTRLVPLSQPLRPVLQCPNLSNLFTDSAHQNKICYISSFSFVFFQP